MNWTGVGQHQIVFLSALVGDLLGSLEMLVGKESHSPMITTGCFMDIRDRTRGLQSRRVLNERVEVVTCGSHDDSRVQLARWKLSSRSAVYHAP